ncbi:low molecular weight phosphatase family protein [soil metagenome]
MTTFNILLVCTANICRSPLMELSLRAALDPERFAVSSAGVHGWDAAPMDKDSARQAHRFGLKTDEFRSRPLQASYVDNANLVLTATREHRTQVLQLSPRALKRTFTLKEFARLGMAQADLPLNELVAAAARKRSTLGAAPLDVGDPYRESYEVHARVADEIHASTTTVAFILGKAVSEV